MLICQRMYPCIPWQYKSLRKVQIPVFSHCLAVREKPGFQESCTHFLVHWPLDQKPGRRDKVNVSHVEVYQHIVYHICLHGVLLTCTLLLEQPASACAPDLQINDKITLVVTALLHGCWETACRQGGVPHALTACTHCRHLCKGGYFGSVRNHTTPAQMFPGDVTLPASVPKEKRNGKGRGRIPASPISFCKWIL